MWHFNTADEYIIGTGYVHWICFGLFPYEFRTISARLPSEIRILRASHPLLSSIILWVLLHQWMLEQASFRQQIDGSRRLVDKDST